MRNRRKKKKKRKIRAVMDLLSNSFNIQITEKKSNERKYFLKWVLLLCFAHSPVLRGLNMNLVGAKISRKHCTSCHSTPFRNNRRGVSGIILYTHHVFVLIHED